MTFWFASVCVCVCVCTRVHACFGRKWEERFEGPVEVICGVCAAGELSSFLASVILDALIDCLFFFFSWFCSFFFFLLFFFFFFFFFFLAALWHVELLGRGSAVVNYAVQQYWIPKPLCQAGDLICIPALQGHS